MATKKKKTWPIIEFEIRYSNLSLNKYKINQIIGKRKRKTKTKWNKLQVNHVKG